MFTLVRRYVKTSLFFFLAGLLLGVIILLLEMMGSPGASRALITAHTHLTLFGFVIMLIMGVAYWMFPRPAKDDLRYSPSVAEINYWLITVGTLMRSLGEISMAVSFHPAQRLIVLAGSALQLASGFIFVWNIWTRVRPIGSQHREAKGEKF